MNEREQTIHQASERRRSAFCSVLRFNRLGRGGTGQRATTPRQLSVLFSLCDNFKTRLSGEAYLDVLWARFLLVKEELIQQPPYCVGSHWRNIIEGI